MMPLVLDADVGSQGDYKTRVWCASTVAGGWCRGESNRHGRGTDSWRCSRGPRAVLGEATRVLWTCCLRCNSSRTCSGVKLSCCRSCCLSCPRSPGRPSIMPPDLPPPIVEPPFAGAPYSPPPWASFGTGVASDPAPPPPPEAAPRARAPSCRAGVDDFRRLRADDDASEGTADIAAFAWAPSNPGGAPEGESSAVKKAASGVSWRLLDGDWRARAAETLPPVMRCSSFCIFPTGVVCGGEREGVEEERRRSAWAMGKGQCARSVGELSLGGGKGN